MLTSDWAAYSQLHESTRERWWDGLVFVCDAGVRSAFRRASWRYAATCFGEAAALELRARVFGPLATCTEFKKNYVSDELSCHQTNRRKYEQSGSQFVFLNDG
jgi:hypothetical protein